MAVKKIFTLFILFAVFQKVHAQRNLLTSVTCDRIPNTDSLWINAKLLPNSKPASLMVVAKAEEANVTDTLFYPLIDTSNDFLLIVPESFTNNNISIKAFYYPSIFQIAGLVNEKNAPAQLMAFLLGDNKAFFNQIIEVSKEKSFALPPIIFENKASVFFNYAGKSKRKPDISIRQFPAIANFRDSVLYQRFDFGASLITSEKYDSLKTAGKLPTDAVRVEGKGKELQQIVVTGTRKTKLDKFKEQFATSLFSDIMEKEYDCLDNDDILNFPNCLMYLQSRTAGVTMGVDQETGEQAVFWRREKVKAYYIDEMKVDYLQVEMLDVNSIAYMKLLPPTFIGESQKGNGGVIAVYTRKGEYVRQGSYNNNWIFSVKGYTSAEHTLFTTKNSQK